MNLIIDRAIKNLEQMVDEIFNPFREEALRLGIEALEREKVRRDYNTAVNPFYPFKPHLLPSETEEEK